MVEGALPEHVRLFIALAVPQEIKEQINRAQGELRQDLRRALVKWTRPEQFHLTLRFLGHVDASKIEQLIDSVRSVGRSIRPLELRAEGLGFFPNLRAPRVVWVGVQDKDEKLRSVQGMVQKATDSFTGERPEDGFSGHITLARIKQIRREEIAVMSRAAECYAGRVLGAWTARELLVLRSELSSQGAEHIVLAKAGLEIDNNGAA